MADRKPFGTDKYAASMAASFMVIIGGMMTTIVLAVAAGGDPIFCVVVAVGVFSLISLVPLRAMRPGRSPQFARGRTESFGSMLAKFFERDDREATPVRPWKRKQTDFIPQPHGNEYFNCFVQDRREKGE